MADEFKTIRDSLFRALGGLGNADDDRADDGEDDSRARARAALDASAARALLGTLFARAGKGKDEVVQIVAREIGVAVAAMLKEPLAQLAKNQKLQISFEFVPKKKGQSTPEAEAPDEEAPRRSKKRRSAPPAAAATKRRRRLRP